MYANVEHLSVMAGLIDFYYLISLIDSMTV